MKEKLESYINEQEGKLAKMVSDNDPANTLFHSGMIFQLRKTIEDLKSLNEAIVRKPPECTCGNAMGAIHSEYCPLY